MKTFRLTIQYDGTAFHGWQVQPATRTVQGVLEEALRSVTGVDGLVVHGAGRTDTGVHARGQVASFACETTLPPRAIVAEANRRLPADVRVREAALARSDFHARHSAVARRYAYRLLDAADVLWARFAWWPGAGADPSALMQATRVLEGRHDCRSFESSGSPSPHPECNILRARWRRWDNGVQLDIVSSHFLYHMVRAVVGTALDAARTGDPRDAMQSVLAARDRRAAGRNAPPQGLSLEEVFYPAEHACV